LDAPDRCIPFYDKADAKKLKDAMLNFQEQFFNSSPYSQDKETNWTRFKKAISGAANESIPKKTRKSKNHLPWITHSIIQKMKERKRLYSKAKCLQIESTWSSYCLFKMQSLEKLELPMPITRTVFLTAILIYIIRNSGDASKANGRIKLELQHSMSMTKFSLTVRRKLKPLTNNFTQFLLMKT